MEDEPDPSATEALELVGPQAGELSACEPDRPGSWTVQTGQYPEEGRLAAPSMGSTTLKTLGAAIEQRFGSTPAYVGAVPVRETFEGKTVWDGVVHVFDIEGGQQCYARAYLEDDHSGKQRIVTVLHEHPVDSPLAAVRAAIVHEARGG